ncbi:MAG: hypothetical protein JOY79_09795 [Acidobacteriaceae bacterium]|nr:hypothetical protein [Acidobacteriaceae bacterium]
MVSSTLLFTVVSSVTFGIYAGYAAVTGILFAFGHRNQKKTTLVPASEVSTQYPVPSTQ